MYTMKKRLKRSTTVYKRLLALFFVTLIPFFALSLMANHIAEVRLREQTEDRLETQLQSMSENYEDLHFRVYSWMKVNLMTDYKVLLANGSISLSAYQLGKYVSELFSSLQELSQMSDDIANITIYMPRTGRVVSLTDYYDNFIDADAAERIAVYEETQRSFLHLQGAYRLQSVHNSSKTQRPLYVAEITLSDESMLRQMNDHGDERYALLSGDEYTLVNEEDGLLMEDVRAYLSADAPVSGKFVVNDYLILYRQFLTDNYLVSYISLETLLKPVQSFDAFSIGTLLMAALCSIVVCYYLSQTINKPFTRLVGVFKQVEQGNMDVTLVPEKRTPHEFAMVYEKFSDMIGQINELMDQRVEHEKALQQAQYRELQSHIAPHFLYNSFNVLRHCILMGDSETAAQMTHLLANYFKYLTYKEDGELLALQEEYQHMLDYLEIQKIRFRDNIIVDIAPLPEAVSQIPVPPFVLQPLVENVFKHGIHDIATGGRITFTTELHGDELHLIVRDNGAGADQEKLRALRQAIANNVLSPEHSGLVNINRRLQLYSQGSGHVEVDSRQDEYFEARICLRITEEKHD